MGSGRFPLGVFFCLGFRCCPILQDIPPRPNEVWERLNERQQAQVSAIRRTNLVITLRVMLCDSTSKLCRNEHRVVVG